MVNAILAKRVNHIVTKGDNPAWPKGSKSRGFSNVKGTDLLKIDQKNTRKDELKQIKPIYDLLELEFEPFKQVKYFYPYSKDLTSYTYEKEDIIKTRIEAGNALQYKYLFETDEDKECLDLLFANVDDPNDTIESIINFIISNGGGFSGIETWEDFKSELYKQTQSDKASKAGKEISVMSWRKFYRLFNKSYQKCQQMFTNKLGGGVRLRDQIRGDIKLYIKNLRENVSGKPVNTRSLRGSGVIGERKTKCTQV